MKDARTFLDCVKKHYPDLPVVVSGHSLGGGTALALALQKPELVNSLLLTAPLVQKAD